MRQPPITVAIPVRNDWDRLRSTISAITFARFHREPLEFVIADDFSAVAAPREEFRALSQGLPDDVTIRVIRSRQRLGVAGARNLACSRATGEILVVTDAHVRFSPGWDHTIKEQLTQDVILAGAVSDPTSQFVGFGCDLVVPFMGTRWRRGVPRPGSDVHVASSAATALLRNTFDRIGGFDGGMIVYGAAEPEFSVRAWLSGHRVVACPGFVVEHHFKTAPERRAFLRGSRHFLLHNNMRFGILYLDDAAALCMVRHLATEFPRHAARALRMLSSSDVWERRDHLRATLKHDFAWFAETVELTDQSGEPLHARLDRGN